MAYPTGELSVDLRAIADNWRIINKQLSGQAECGAVVKANAYGLGVDRVAPTIYRAGCRNFFVANLKEAIQLQSLVGLDTKIFVLSGCIAGAETEFIRRKILPVLVSLQMCRRWAKFAAGNDEAHAVLKIDTGMARLGFDSAELDTLLDDKELLMQSNIRYLMSHLACADDKSKALNKTQIERFELAKARLSAMGLEPRTTLANSAGVFLDRAAHCDIVRPGIALFGGNPGLDKNPMQSVVGLNLPIIQVRRLPVGEYVGYGATRSFDDERVLAIASGGYADGIMRSLSNRGWGYLNGSRVPIVGRISMDSTIFDVTDALEAADLPDGSGIEILGKHVSIDDLAKAAGTISYEILTSFGSRYQRCYIE